MNDDAPDPQDVQTLKWGAIVLIVLPALVAVIAVTIAQWAFPHWTW